MTTITASETNVKTDYQVLAIKGTPNCRCGKGPMTHRPASEMSQDQAELGRWFDCPRCKTSSVIPAAPVKATRTADGIILEAIEARQDARDARGRHQRAGITIHAWERITTPERAAIGRRLLALGCPKLDKDFAAYDRFRDFIDACVDGHEVTFPDMAEVDRVAAGTYCERCQDEIGREHYAAVRRKATVDELVAERLQAVEDIANVLADCKPSWSLQDHVAGPSEPRERDISLFVREARSLVMKAVEIHYSDHRWAEWAEVEVWEAASAEERGCMVGFLHAIRFIPPGHEVATDTGASEFFGDFFNLCLQGSPISTDCPKRPTLPDRQPRQVPEGRLTQFNRHPSPEDTQEPETCNTPASGHSSGSPRGGSPSGMQTGSLVDDALAALSNAPNSAPIGLLMEGLEIDEYNACLDAFGPDETVLELPVNPGYHRIDPSPLDCADWDAIQAFGAC